MLHSLINKTINESLVHVTSYQCMHVTSIVHIQISLDNTNVYKFAFYICKIKYKLVNNKNNFFIIFFFFELKIECLLKTETEKYNYKRAHRQAGVSPQARHGLGRFH